MTHPAIETRYKAAQRIAKLAGHEALRYFQSYETLTIDKKGHQDLVSEGDRNVELLVRKEIAAAFPDDSIVGEEHAAVAGNSGYTWVIDPIDGTANFVRGIPAWTVVIAITHASGTVIGVIHDPVHGELFHTQQGHGAFLNDRPIHVAADARLTEGSVGIGFSARTSSEATIKVVGMILDEGGVFFRNASGALMLTYVACGKLLAYVEEHMNAWDCLAGQLLVHEAGGVVENQDAGAMITDGGRVVVASPGVWPEILRIADSCYT